MIYVNTVLYIFCCIESKNNEMETIINIAVLACEKKNNSLPHMYGCYMFGSGEPIRRLRCMYIYFLCSTKVSSTC